MRSRGATCSRPPPPTPEQARAFRVADNKVASLSRWDDGLLEVELVELGELGIDVESMGFSEAELQELMAPQETDAIPDRDDVAEPPKVAVTRPGDLWLLGRHRLLCGDSTKLDEVLRVMDGEKATLVATDPPYLVDYTGDRPNDSGKD